MLNEAYFKMILHEFEFEWKGTLNDLHEMFYKSTASEKK